MKKKKTTSADLAYISIGGSRRVARSSWKRERDTREIKSELQILFSHSIVLCDAARQSVLLLRERKRDESFDLVRFAREFVFYFSIHFAIHSPLLLFPRDTSTFRIDGWSGYRESIIGIVNNSHVYRWRTVSKVERVATTCRAFAAVRHYWTASSGAFISTFWRNDRSIV